MTRTRCCRCGGEISYADVLSLPRVTRPILDECQHDWRIVPAGEVEAGRPLFAPPPSDLLAPWARFLADLEAAGKL